MSLEPKIVFVAIIRNESRIIRRCLDTVKPILDAIVISDTGSTDNTVEIVESYIRESGLPGIVVHHSWENFAKNRTLSFRAAKDFIKTRSDFDLNSTYAIFLDADMKLVIEPEFSKKSLTQSFYYVFQHNHEINYPNLRLASMKYNWRSVSDTHEYWSARGVDTAAHRTENSLSTLWIDDQDDGGCKSDKFERDIRLLSSALVREPYNERYMFYLAQSHKSIRKWDQAMEWYHKRIAAGGWFEEIYYSKYQIGECYREKCYEVENVRKAKEKELDKFMKDHKEFSDLLKYRSVRKELERKINEYTIEREQLLEEEWPEVDSEMQKLRNEHQLLSVPLIQLEAHSELSGWEQMKKDWEEEITRLKKEQEEYWSKAHAAYLHAFQFNNRRAEPIFRICEYERTHGRNDVAYMYASMGLEIPHPKEHEDRLFITSSVYEYEFYRELSICAYYTRFRDEGFDMCEALMNSPSVPEWIKTGVHSNEVFYITRFRPQGQTRIDIERPFITTTEKYRGTNPSIISEDHGYTLIFRTVNYDHVYDEKGEDTWIPLDEDQNVRTRNYLVKLDKWCKVISSHEIIEGPKFEERKKYPTRVLGLEDCRLFKIGTRYWFTCTTLDTSPHSTAQITLARLKQKPNAEGKYDLDFFLPLIGPDPKRCEKNWLPFEYEGDIGLYYNSDPTTIMTIDRKTGETKKVKENETNFDFERFRGGAGPLEFDKGYLVIIHEVVFREHRHYYHRFLWMNREFKIQKFSRPFYLYEYEENGKAKHYDVEFAIGMCYGHDGKSILISAGVNDSQAWLFQYSIEEIRKNLRTMEEE